MIFIIIITFITYTDSALLANLPVRLNRLAAAADFQNNNDCEHAAGRYSDSVISRPPTAADVFCVRCVRVILS